MDSSPALPRNGRPDARPGRVLAAYALTLLAAVGLFFLIRWYGEGLGAPAAPAGAPAAAPARGADVLRHVLSALAAIVVTGRLLAWLFRRLGQPPVIGEVVAGILLGPSLLGADLSALVLPPAVEEPLGVLSQLGVVLYMFLVGLELDPRVFRGRGHVTLAISHASIVLPFSLGAALALGLYPLLAPPGVPFTSFALFMGVALAITAFPVLARILTDRRMEKTELGVIALGCAAADDVTAWCLLALVVGVAQAHVGSALRVLLLAAAFVALMFLVVRPLARRLLAPYTDESSVGPGVIAALLVALLVAAVATEAIGIHAIFGPFLLGAVIPHDSPVVRVLHRKLHDLVTILLLPAFFAFTGMRTQIGLVAGAEQWLACGAILLAATLGKFGGTFAAARATGLPWRDATCLGVLMNTRGLMELIVLNVGLKLGVISETLFAMMVLMALATTLATAPLLQLLGPPRNPAPRPGEYPAASG